MSRVAFSVRAGVVIYLTALALAACSSSSSKKLPVDASQPDSLARDGGADSKPPSPDQGSTAVETQLPDSQPARLDAGPPSDATVGDSKTAPDATAADSKIGPVDSQPGPGADAVANDGKANYIPPMPNVASDPTLTDTTDFGTSSGFKIILDYRYDTAQYMTRERRLVMRTAAASWEQLIASDFAAVAANTTIRARDPQDTEAGGSRLTVSYPIDDLVIFVGSTTIDGPGGTAAQAYSSNTTAGMSADMAATMTQRYEGNPFQPWVATITFDNEEDPFVDATMNSDDDIPPSQVDLYSVALHELGHALGIGSAAAFKALTSNSTFTGENAQTVYGGPVPLSSDGFHVLKTVRSDGRRIVMDESDASGERSFITHLDLALLQDLGYAIKQ